MRHLVLFLLCGPLCGTLKAQLTIMVDAVPANTPATDSLYIVGDFNAWNPGDGNFQLHYSPSLQRFEVLVDGTNNNLTFKFTRGSWASVEGTASGGFIPDRTLSYQDGDTVYLQIAGWEDLSGGGNPNSTAQPNVQILSDSVFMPQFNRYRRVWVYVPPDYATTNYHYPVLYMHDGQNVFDATTSFSGEWEVDETLNALHAAGDRGIIVVAVDNGQNFRLDEYSPWLNPNYGGGQGALYVDFLVQTLKPHIDSLYRSLPDRENTGIMGSSMGGLISTYAGIEHQAVFGKIGAFSPAYWFSSASFAHVAQTGKAEDMRIYQLIGSPEGATYVADMYRMEDSLFAGGFSSAEILSVTRADGQHSEWFWAREFSAAYDWLFRSTSTPIEPSLPALTQIQLYPNPVRDALQIELVLTERVSVRLEIVDLLGQSYGQKSCDSLLMGKQVLRWDLQELPLSAGVYLLQVQGPNATYSQRFIFQPR